jgi:hypothetical protein
MVLLKDMNCQLCPEGNKKNSNKYKKQLKKMKDEVGMAGPKSTQTIFVRIITSTIHPYACFLSSCMGRRNKLTNNVTILIN